MSLNNELLSVVDQSDQVIDTLPRYQVHAEGLCHRAVHILVFNSKNLLFLQKRSMNKDLNKGLWDSSAAGHVDAGEDYLSCAIRELKEELGITLLPNALRPLFKISPTAELGMEFIQVYSCVYDGEVTLNRDEIDESRWFYQDTITRSVVMEDIRLTMTFKHIWQQYLELQFC